MLQGARDLTKGRQTAKQIGGDFTDARQIAELAAWIEREHDRLDVLVNNAGGHADGDARAESAAPADVRAALETNLLGAWQLSSAVLPLVRRHRYGRIVNVTSGCAGVTAPDAVGYPAYRVSKATLNAYIRALAAELAGSGIPMCPGWLATGLGGPGGGPVGRGTASAVTAACQPELGINGALLRDGQRIAW